MKRQGISLSVAGEGHCKLSELRGIVKWKKGIQLKSDSEETMSGLPEPGPGSSCVGDPGRVNTAEAIRDQSWEQKTGQQGPAVQMNQESVQRRPGPQLGVAWGPRELAASLTLPSLTQLTPCPLVSLSFFMKKKFTKLSVIPDLMLHHEWYLEILLERTYVLKLTGSIDFISCLIFFKSTWFTFLLIKME